MIIHPRLASLLYFIIVLPIYAIFKKLLDWNIAVDIILIILNTIISTLIYSHLVKKYDDEDMII